MKHLITLLFLIILIFSAEVQAQYGSSNSLDETDLNALEAGSPPASKQVVLSEIIEIDRGLLIDRRDDETGVNLDQYNIARDDTRYSLLLHFNANLAALTGITSFEFAYAKKLETAWMEFFISKATVSFTEVTSKNPNDLNLANLTDEDLDFNKSGLLTFGGGLAYRTTFIQNLVPSDRVFETVAGHLTYSQFSEPETEVKYAGWGVRADFGVHYRMNESFHIGGKMSYNLSTVRRSTEIDFNPETVTSAERSLALNWVSLGFDLSYYF
jgi:hypothetical protein